MTDQLRSLLRQAVPDDVPALDPNAVAAAARRARRRARTAIASTVAATVVAASALAAVTTGEEDRAAQDPALDPYAAPACPADLSEPSLRTPEVEDLDGVTSIRYCPDFQSGPEPAPNPAEQEELFARSDALLDMGDFREALETAPAFDPGRCAAIDMAFTLQALQLTLTGGRTLLVSTGVCQPVSVDGRRTDGQFLGSAFLEALDRQRDQLDYRAPGAGVPTCDGPSVPGPARPGREELVSAVACLADGAQQELDDSQLERLARAWEQPVPVPPVQEPDGSCPWAPGEEPSFVVRTDRGDLVRLAQTGCEFLSLDSFLLDPTEEVAFSITAADLGLTP